MNAIGNFWLALLVAPLGVALLGLAIEYAGIRRLYAAGHDYQLLFTFGLSLILARASSSSGGRSASATCRRRSCAAAWTWASPSIRSTGCSSWWWRACWCSLTWLFLEKTRYGAIMRAGIENKEMVSLLGIDIQRLFTVAFALGAYLAGIAGALTAPIRGLIAGHGRGHARHRVRGGGARRPGQPARARSPPA